MRSKLVFQATRILGSLEHVTPQAIVNYFLPSTRNNDRFIDTYILVASGIPLILVTALPYLPFLRFAWPLAAWRIFEIIVSLLNTLVFDDYRAGLEFKKPKPLAGVRRPLVLFPFIYAELILWFAFLYRVMITSLQEVTFNAWVKAINLSFVRISAFGSSSIEIDCPCVTLIMLAESAIGLFMALAAISWFVSLIPSRESDDPVERRINR